MGRSGDLAIGRKPIPHFAIPMIALRLLSFTICKIYPLVYISHINFQLD